MAESAAAAALSAWFVATAVANLLPRGTWLRRSRLSWLLPEWRFFAPEPATHDYDVFCRFRGTDTGPTHPFVVPFPARRGANVALNPHSRSRKATRDAIEELLQAAQAGRANLRNRSSGYVALLRETAQLAPHGPDLSHVQFGILVVEGTQSPRLVFVSRWEAIR